MTLHKESERVTNLSAKKNAREACEVQLPSPLIGYGSLKDPTFWLFSGRNLAQSPHAFMCFAHVVCLYVLLCFLIRSSG